MYVGTTSACSNADIASLFNAYFNTTFTRAGSTSAPPSNVASSSSTLSDVVISKLDVYEALAALDTTKAKGIDGIDPIHLKHCAVALYEFVYHLFSQCLLQHSLPSEWRIHLITPLFKSGDRSSVTNYRPISLLCIISKVI